MRAFLLLVVLLGIAPAVARGQSFVYDFETGYEGWAGDFADYPLSDSVAYELAFGRTRMPIPLDSARYALRISGKNGSDDLFMFTKRKIAGLLPNATYDVVISADIASRYPTNAFGAGGAPGEGVTVKAGATIVEPVKVPVNGYFRMNIDKSNQLSPGADMDTIGHVGVADTTTVYAIIHRSNASHPFRIKADDQGVVWVCIGTESGYESTTTLYYDRITVTFNSATGVGDESPMPVRIELGQNYPNPFNPTTVVSFQLPVASDVKLAVYDLLGREVAVLVDEQRARGRNAVRFDTAGLASGVYFYRLTAGRFVETRKMILAR